METVTISKQYSLKYQFKEANFIQVADDKTIINTQTGRILKKTINGGSIGYWINRKFIILKTINSHLEDIPKPECPF